MLTLVAVAVLSLSVLGPPVQAQDNLSAQELADLHALAEQGDVWSQFILGAMYVAGLGVPQDAAEGARWFRLAAEQGDAIAQYNLGVQYGAGEGVPQDFAEAALWHRLAAEQGDAWAQSILGFMYATGEGVAQDAVEAVRWYRLGRRAGTRLGAVQPRS